MSAPDKAEERKLPRPKLSLADRLLESLWGILIVLSVTGSAELWIGATSAQVFLIGLVTAFAWGVVEAVMDLLRRQLERVRQARLIARAAESLESAEGDLADALRDSPIQHLAPEDQALVRRAILDAAKRAPIPNLRIRKNDLVSSVETGIVLWSSTLPALAPFLVISESRTAVAISQAIAVAILFALGAAWGRFSGQSALRIGAVMALIGLGLAGLLQVLNA